MPVSRVLGVDFTSIGLNDLLGNVMSGPAGSLQTILTCNVDHLRLLQCNADFRRAYLKAWVVTVDGAPISAYAKWKGLPCPVRLPGADLFEEILKRLKPGQHRPLFVTSSVEVSHRLIARLVALGFCEGDVASASPAFGFEASQQASTELVHAIGRHRPTHVFFGLGAPKSEVWLEQHREELPSAYAFCFGAGLEFAAGLKRRAPAFMRDLGLEWAWRVMSEPNRLAVRYVKGASFLLRLLVGRRHHD
jgi:N-acetylglucosaminyldiphosphoundecaprenol N-acetyl-beta-D-mannosaminyltransferase